MAETHAGPSQATAGPLKILVVLRAVNMDRITEGFLRCALDRGHTVHVALEQKKAGFAEGAESLFDVLAAEYPAFSFGRLAAREERWLYPAARLRRAIDLIRYYEPEFRTAETLRARARSRAPWYVRLPAVLGLLRVKPYRRALNWFLRGVERRMPLSEASLEMLRDRQPDVLVVSPLVELGSPQGDHLRAADALGIPTALVVASWDNLTTKGAIRDTPDMTIVWNEDQVREAIELHGLPSEQVLASGAHSHDHWFDWKPSMPAEEFAAKVGLAAERPYVLYVCSSGFIAGADEVEFVREWSQRLTQSGDPELESLGVLVRPHPQNYRSWEEAELEQPGRLVVWPRGGVAPTDPQSKHDYFDSLHYARAVVGINTSALVDSAIIRRPVFTIVSDQFRDTQTGTVHFTYLAREGGGGLLSVAGSWEEHLAQLGAAVRAPDAQREKIDDFLRAFIRPHGLERPAAPIAIGAIEEAAAITKRPAEPGGPVRWLVGAGAAGLGRLHDAREWLRPQAFRKRSRQRQKLKAREQKQQATQERRELGAGARPGKQAGAKRPKDGRAKRSKPPKEARVKGPKPPRAKRPNTGRFDQADGEATPGERTEEAATVGEPGPSDSGGAR